MSARRRPETAIFQSGVFEGKPESGNRDRIGVKEGRILVRADFATDSGLLEDVHRLQRQWINHSDVVRHFGKFWAIGKSFELVVEIVLSMADLVDAQLLWLRQMLPYHSCWQNLQAGY